MKIDKLPILLSLGSFVLALFGALRLHFYYNAFYIDIFSFMGLGELLTKSIVYAIPVTGIWVAITLLFLLVLNRKRWPFEASTTIWKSLLKFIREQPLASLFLVLIIWRQVADVWKSALVEFNDVDNSDFTQIVILVLGIMPFLAPFALDKFTVLTRRPRPGAFAQYVVFAFLLTCFDIVNIAVSEVDGVMVEHYFKEVNIHLEDGRIIEGNDSVYYVGHTEQYLFVHHYFGLVSDVYPMSEVKKIESY